MAKNQGKRWQKMLQCEHDQRNRLEELVEQLGKQHSNLEKQVRKSMSNVLNLNHGTTPRIGQRQTIHSQ